MKKSVLFVCLILTFIQVEGQTTIQGKFESMENWSNEVYLLGITNYGDVFSATTMYEIDTVMVDSFGFFEFRLDELPCEGCLYRIDVRPQNHSGVIIYGGTSKENFALFELKEGQEIRIEGNADQLTRTFQIKESDNWSYEEIRRLRESVYEISDSISLLFSDPQKLMGKDLDSLKEVSIKKIVEAADSNNKILFEYISRSASIYDKILGMKIYDYDMKMDNDIDLYEHIVSTIDTVFHLHPYYQQLVKDIHETKYVLPVGSIAPNLILESSGGELISLEEIGENLILLDFWASWCSPCRHENRQTVKPLYDRFKDKGFKVYSVSMDDNKEKWNRAIEADQMTWVNVSDLLGTNSEVYSIYKIDGLPTTYLIESEGFKILGRNMRGEELMEFVESYYEK